MGISGLATLAAPALRASGCRVGRVCGSLPLGHLDLHAGFAFSSLWFAHFCLQALAQLRAANSAVAANGAAVPERAPGRTAASHKLPSTWINLWLPHLV